MIFKLVVQRCCRVKLKQKVLCSSEVHAGCCTSSPDVYWKLKEACKNKTHQQDKKDERKNCRERSCNREQDISDLTLQLQTHQRSSEFKLKLIPDDCPADITVTAAAKSNWTYRVQYSFISQWHGANFCPSLLTLTHFTEVNHTKWNLKLTYQKVGMGL